MNRFSERIYKVAIYLRLSKEDGDLSFSSSKFESNSISNQRKLIENYILLHPDLQFVEEYKDDGYTGTNFDRSDFNRMMDDIYAKKIDCVIVKDLSRFGRDYIDCGKYIEKVFPKLDVRFIAVTDNYDSANIRSADSMYVPMKNLMNDTYSRDISEKVRSHLNTRREHGKFTSSHAMYGYLKDPNDKNHLIIDDYAASIVRDIFKWKIEGLSPESIATRLNEMGILSPMEYKKVLGIPYQSNFKTIKNKKWSHVTVRRILKDEVYTGVLLQGKRSKPNHKSKKYQFKDEALWVRVENAHAHIISRRDFDIVQTLLLEDTHAISKDGDIPAYSGRIYCAECGAPMVRKTVYSNGKRYVYYVCSAHKADKSVCGSHSIRETLIDELAVSVIQKHIEAILKVEEASKNFEEAAWEQNELGKISIAIESQEDIIQKNNLLLANLYEDLQDGVLEKEEYISIKEEINNRIATSNSAISELKKRKLSLEEGFTISQEWLQQFDDFQANKEITRKLIVNLVQKISVGKDKEVRFTLMFADEVHDRYEFYKELNRKNKIIVLPVMEVV